MVRWCEHVGVLCHCHEHAQGAENKEVKFGVDNSIQKHGHYQENTVSDVDTIVGTSSLHFLAVPLSLLLVVLVCSLGFFTIIQLNMEEVWPQVLQQVLLANVAHFSTWS